MGFFKDVIATILGRKNYVKPIEKQIVIKQPEVKPKNFRKENENTKFSQVKKHLFEHGQIDSWTAINLYGATRLSAIIFELRQKGYSIRSVKNSAFDRNNEVCNFTTYIFNENGNN
jgi:hypothetical protein